MRKYLLMLLLLLIFIQIENSAYAKAEEYASEELRKKYVQYMGCIDSDIACVFQRPVAITVQELCQALRPLALQEFYKPWTKTLNKLLSGKKKWKREKIENILISLTYIDCENGLSAIPLILALGNTYTNKDWSFSTPIKLELFEERPQHHESLQLLADIVNAAYPKYFNVVVPTQSPSNSHIVMSCNLRAERPITELGAMLKGNGILFLVKSAEANIQVPESLEPRSLTWQKRCLDLNVQGLTYVKKKNTEEQ